MAQVLTWGIDKLKVAQEATERFMHDYMRDPQTQAQKDKRQLMEEVALELTEAVQAQKREDAEALEASWQQGKLEMESDKENIETKPEPVTPPVDPKKVGGRRRVIGPKGEPVGK